jgi:hypothetical protein
VQGWLTGGCGGVPTAVVDGGLEEGFGSVLHDKECIRSMPLHENGGKLRWSGGSSKRVGGHRHDDMERRRQWTNGGADWSLSYVWSRGSAGTCS